MIYIHYCNINDCMFGAQLPPQFLPFFPSPHPSHPYPVRITRSDLSSELFHVVFHPLPLGGCVGSEGHTYQLVQDYPSPGRELVNLRLS